MLCSRWKKNLECIISFFFQHSFLLRTSKETQGFDLCDGNKGRGPWYSDHVKNVGTDKDVIILFYFFMWIYCCRTSLTVTESSAKESAFLQTRSHGCSALTVTPARPPHSQATHRQKPRLRGLLQGRGGWSEGAATETSPFKDEFVGKVTSRLALFPCAGSHLPGDKASLHGP